MTEETAQKKLAQTEATIDGLTPEQQEALRPLLCECKVRHDQIKISVAAGRNALADWSLLMKYLVFDHEARCREAG